MPIAGFDSHVKVTTAGIDLTKESMQLVSGKTFEIIDDTKRVLDPSVVDFVVFEDDGFGSPIDVTIEVLSIDLLFGKVTFKPSHTPTEPIEIDGKFLPLNTVAEVFSADWADENTLDPSTVFGDSAMARIKLLKTFSGAITFRDSISTVVDGGTQTLQTISANGDRVVFEFGIDDSDTAVLFRAFVKLENVNVTGEVAGQIEGNASMVGDAATTNSGIGVGTSNWSTIT